jgi:hypothetical protein
MYEVYMLQPMTSSCDLFCSGQKTYVSEPNLDELMRDPMTQALMAADRVDDGELHALFAHMRQNRR